MSVDFLAWIKASQKHTARTEEFYKVCAAPGPCTLAASPLHFRTSCRHLWMGTCTTRMNLQASAARYVLALAHAVCPSSCICLRTSKSATPARLSEGSWRSALRLPMRKQKRQDCAAQTLALSTCCCFPGCWWRRPWRTTRELCRVHETDGPQGASQSKGLMQLALIPVSMNLLRSTLTLARSCQN